MGEMSLEDRVRSLELGAELLAQSTTEAVHRLDKELEATDERLCETWADQQDRIDKLERIFEADAERFIPDAEVQHQARWHATYNAALTGIMGTDDSAVNTDEAVEFVAEQCRMAADRAHGPLEAKADGKQSAIAEAAIDACIAIEGHEARVHKLVTVVQHWKHQLASREAMESVNAALKPFEGVS